MVEVQARGKGWVEGLRPGEARELGGRGKGEGLG